jgi:peptide/nickel transport system permease protein
LSGFAQYLLRRLGVSVVSLLGVTVIVVLLVQMLPGDPARVIAGLQASPQEVERIRAALGLNQPVFMQYWLFLQRLLQGNLGESARTGRPVLQEILFRLPATITLAAAGTLIGSVIGVFAGVVAAIRRSTKVDYLVSFASVIGVSIPVYWLGMMLIIVFAVNLRVLPASGADEPAAIVLPAVTLGAFSMALVARMTRGSMLEVLEQDYVRTARAKGVRERMVIFKHALRNAFIPVLTVIGLQFGSLLGGAVLTESVFGWPGIGRLLVESIFSRDFPIVQGVVFVYAVLLVIVNLATDALYTLVDPRIRYYG